VCVCVCVSGDVVYAQFHWGGGGGGVILNKLTKIKFRHKFVSAICMTVAPFITEALFNN
jgi:hypothetical protein